MTPDEDHRSLPRNPSGPGSTAWWGMVLFLLIELMVIGSMIVSYFYLRVMNARAWPPAGISTPDLLLSSVATGLLVLSVVPVTIALRAQRADRRGRALAGLGGAMLLLLGYMVLSWVDARSQEYTHRTNVYGSMVVTLSGYQLAHAAGLLLLGLVVAFMSWRRRITAAWTAPLEITALYWYFVAAVGVPTYATLYLAPYVL